MSTINLVSGSVPFYDDLAGASNQWSDGSDSTWASARSFQNLSGGNSNFSAGTILQQFTAADASAITGVTLSIRMAVTNAPAAAGSPVPVSYAWFPSTSLYPSPRPNGYFDAPVDSTPHDYTVSVTDPDLIAALAAEGVTLSMGFHVSDVGGVDHGASLPTPPGYTYRVEIYEVSVVVAYGLPSIEQLTWRTNRQLVQQIDVATGAIRVLTAAQSGIPEPESNLQLGSLVRVDNGNILVNTLSQDNTTDDQTGFVVGPNLETSSAFAWNSQHDPYLESFGRSMLSDYEWTGGAYDAVTGLTWLSKTSDASAAPYEWTGYDATGTPVAGRGDISTVSPSGDAFRFAGSFGRPVSAQITAGRWLYRFSHDGDGVIRYNLDDDRWQLATFNASSDVIGVTAAGTIVCMVRGGSSANFITTYGPSSPSWVDATGIAGSGGLLTPDQTFDPTPSGGGTLVGAGLGDGGARVFGNSVIYAVQYSPSNYGDPSFGWYSLDLTTGAVSLIVDVPYHAYRADGTQIADADANTAPDWYTDNGFPLRIAGLLFGSAAPPPVTPYVAAVYARPSLRMLQRGGSGGMSGIPRMVGDPTRRGSLRQGPGSVY